MDYLNLTKLRTMSNQQSSKESYVLLTIGVLLFFGLIVLYVFEFPFLTNTRDVQKLVKTSVSYGLGLVAAAVILGYLTKMLHKDSLRLHIFFSIAFLAFCPFFMSFSNRKLSTKKPYSESYSYIGQKGYYMELFSMGKKPRFDTYWLYLIKNDKEYKFRTNSELPQSASAGSKVRLVMNQGFWGFDYFDGSSWEFM